MSENEKWDWADEAPEEITGAVIAGLEAPSRKKRTMSHEDSTSGILVHFEILPRRKNVIRSACGKKIKRVNATTYGNLATTEKDSTTCRRCLSSDLYRSRTTNSEKKPPTSSEPPWDWADEEDSKVTGVVITGVSKPRPSGRGRRIQKGAQ